MINFLYNTFLGRAVLKIITKIRFSQLIQYYLNSKFSKHKIYTYIKKYHIPMEEYEEQKYTSFNEFFTRKIKEGKRPINRETEKLCAVADAKLTYYKISKNLILKIKNFTYTVEELLKNKELAEKYKGGICLIFRLSPEDYHRYIYLDNGKQQENIKIKGILHSVSPVATEKYKVYGQNSREYTILQTENFGEVLQIEIGALLVGKIINHKQNASFSKGEEKGYFAFGGSTIVLLFEEHMVNIDKDIKEKSIKGEETIVKLGQVIGEKLQ